MCRLSRERGHQDEHRGDKHDEGKWERGLEHVVKHLAGLLEHFGDWIARTAQGQNSGLSPLSETDSRGPSGAANVDRAERQLCGLLIRQPRRAASGSPINQHCSYFPEIDRDIILCVKKWVVVQYIGIKVNDFTADSSMALQASCRTAARAATCPTGAPSLDGAVHHTSNTVDLLVMIG